MHEKYWEEMLFLKKNNIVYKVRWWILFIEGREGYPHGLAAPSFELLSHNLTNSFPGPCSII